MKTPFTYLATFTAANEEELDAKLFEAAEYPERGRVFDEADLEEMITNFAMQRAVPILQNHQEELGPLDPLG